MSSMSLFSQGHIWSQENFILQNPVLAIFLFVKSRFCQNISKIQNVIGVFGFENKGYLPKSTHWSGQTVTTTRPSKCFHFERHFHYKFLWGWNFLIQENVHCNFYAFSLHFHFLTRIVTWGVYWQYIYIHWASEQIAAKLEFMFSLWCMTKFVHGDGGGQFSWL